MSDTDYRKIISELPDLAAQLAGAIIPSSQPSDIPSSGGDPAEVEAARVKAIDDLDRVMAFLADQADLWFEVLAVIGEVQQVRELEVTDGRYRQIVADDPLVAWRDAHKITAWLLHEWPDVEGHPLFYQLTDAADERPCAGECLPREASIVQLVNRLEVRKTEQRPRQCLNCKAIDVWADTEHTSAVCASCTAVTRAEIWMPVKDVAKSIGRDPSKIRAWIRAGHLESRPGRFGQEVNLAAAKDVRDEMEARKKLGIAL